MRRSLFSFAGFCTSYRRISFFTRPRKASLNLHTTWRLPAMRNSIASTSTDEATCFEYRWIDGVEVLERYRPGGYHPTVIGDVLADRYHVIHKLGYGTFSIIWLARDKQRETYVAIKISTANAPAREAAVLRALADYSSGVGTTPGRDMVPIVQDQFELQGPNGFHKCYVTSPAQGSVATAKFCDLFTVETARVLAAQLVLAVVYTHARGFVHGDIHLGNTLIRLPSGVDELSVEQLYETFGQPQTEHVVRVDGQALLPNAPPHATVPVWLGKTAHRISPSEAHLLLSDFGEAFSPATEKRRGDECHSPLTVSPPEALFEPEKPLSFSADVWALACAIWSILATRPLFDGTLATCDDITSQQVDVLASSAVPAEWWNNWEARQKYFVDIGRQPVKGRSVFPSLESMFEEDVQAVRRDNDMADFGLDETAALLAMLRSILVFRPEERATADAVMGSEWMVNWALPELNKIWK